MASVPVPDVGGRCGDMAAGDSNTALASACAPAFERLPEEIIQQVLQLTDPNSFASLILLNSKWRRVSQHAHLYAHHLSRCPSYSAIHSGISPDTAKDEDLPRLRRLFSREIKRNLFEVYLRPKSTTIKIVSNSISSSSAPGGEGMQFSPSPRGHHLLAYNSSRIYVLDLRGSDLEVKRELKILRRPVSTCILDEGTLLAVLSTDMQVDLYDLRESPPRRSQSLILDHTPRTIALSPCGSVLAAAYEGGIEVSSLRPGAMSTDRRAVKCDAVDYLAFSFDGTQLLGTTTIAHQPNTVILTAPYYDPGAQMGEESISALWTTSILFPNTSRDCSHAVLLQESSSQEASWTFTYDRSFETFRAVRIDDLRNGTTYFTGPIPHSASQATLLPCTLPAASYCGELVSAGFEGKDVWLYGIPEDLEAISDITSDSGTPGLSRRSSAPSIRSPSRSQEPTGGRVPQWQILCDRNRNTFVSGRKITELNGVSTVKWIAGHGDFSYQERLIVAARGVMPPRPITEEDGIDFVDGGRVTILDFDYGIVNGQEMELTIEVGTKEPEALEEEHRDMATEVAIVRRRTVAQRGGGRSNVMRSTTLADRRAEDLLRHPVPAIPRDEDEDPLIPRRMVGPRTEAGAPSATADAEEPSLEEVQEALDAPYAHASPRSAPTLRRAATAAAVNRRLHPSAATGGRIEYRRADGRAEHPHESDADNWVPPPPPYSQDDPVDLPAFLRHAAIPGVGVSTTIREALSATSSQAIHTPSLPSAAYAQIPPGDAPTTEGSYQLASGQARPGLPRRPASSPTNRSASPLRRFSQGNDLYNVSPVEPPHQYAQLPQRLGRLDTGTEQRVYSGSQAPSSNAQSSSTGIPHFPSTAHPAAIRSSVEPTNPYTLNVAIPSPGFNNAMWNDIGASPQVGRLPNASTWPRAPQPGPSSAAIPTGYPYSAPVIDENNAAIVAAALPPAPTRDQLASLHRRRESAAPRPISCSFQVPRVPVGGQPPSFRNSQALGAQRAPEPEQPLIISTPKGVSGAFDAPDRQASQRHPGEPMIHSPVPRHPGPHLGAGGNDRPTVERLETIYSIASSGGRGMNEPVVLQNAQGQTITIPPAPPSAQLTLSSLRHHTSLTRRQSRARRSAAKNVQDAKNRGWTGRRKKNKKKDSDAMSSAWTDITWASKAPKDGNVKEKRCIIM
ncbi:hypothetical protein BKA67DRAFT_634108 [Truncatella angustata]|uniref:F-box domain-containing protein n=1 Tax=Truncatella angustata TaxID=152316 RepID=A0A9P9A1W4_9PEZI|nr:uncharacterized protein BKA67DRAFT_634108 [Truncatella angustata]KAH6660016.1 hypothetical protein BKA67DRAFT_634108 [Truncatella angustata]